MQDIEKLYKENFHNDAQKGFVNAAREKYSRQGGILNVHLTLAAAIISEVFGRSMLFPSIGVAIGHVAALYLLSLALNAIPLARHMPYGRVPARL